jgi:hypothetical protein
VLAARACRAATLTVEPLDTEGRVYRVSGGKAPHQVIADAQGLACDCSDFRFNRLGACAHTLAVLLLQERQHTPMSAAAAVAKAGGSALDALRAETAALRRSLGRISAHDARVWVTALREWCAELQAEDAGVLFPAPASIMAKYRAARAEIAREKDHAAA